MRPLPGPSQPAYPLRHRFHPDPSCGPSDFHNKKSLALWLLGAVVKRGAASGRARGPGPSKARAAAAAAVKRGALELLPCLRRKWVLKWSQLAERERLRRAERVGPRQHRADGEFRLPATPERKQEGRDEHTPRPPRGK
ncbi:hypothetical protein AAFF_G00304830 [Aldrovandia affinis]|uniref:Uncharacterized protein n=1 Tax=Aldrovandia affinis TaxID=143900 RepID=A0AAD7SQG1_9TELE|nr:hypothetical protein AAFF_G00304830 [Aldrovandia affinis]